MQSGNLVHRYLAVVITSVPFTCEELPFASLLKVVPIIMAQTVVNNVERDRGLLEQCCFHPVTVSCGIIGFGNG